MSLKETLERIRTAPTPPNEETAKIQIITPILQDLGWNPLGGADVLFEHKVATPQGEGKVDIALRGKKYIVAHIEAKSPGVDLRKHVKQALGYAFEEGAQISCLTTGLKWQLYLPLEPGPPNQRLFSTLRLQDGPVDQLAEDLETFLGRENLDEGRSASQARKVLKARHEADHLQEKLPEIWRRMVKNPPDELIRLITEQAYAELGLRPDPVHVLALLRDEHIPAIARPEPSSGTLPKPNLASGTKIYPGNKPVSGTKPVAFELWDDRIEVSTWKEILVGVATKLYRRHGYGFNRILELKGTTRHYASRRQEDIPVRSAKIADSGIYIDVNFSAEDSKKRAVIFLNFFGHSPDDLTIETR
ncbi:MAG: hypothetical protein OXH33_04740 [bacterium]|nr:hypothetical protein [bacterium]